MISLKSKNAFLHEGERQNESMPYERFIKYGADSLTDAELLAIIIRTGTGKLSAVDIGKRLLDKSEKYERGLSGLCHLTKDEIMAIPGIGEVKAVKLMCISELSKRIAKSDAIKRLRFNSPKSIASYFMEELCHEEKEQVHLLCFNNQLELLCEELLTVGTVNMSLLSVRDVFVAALKNRAVNIVLIHNHPGGDPYPSSADFNLTENIRKAGELLEMRLRDHIIIGNHRYYSFKEHGILN